MKPLWLIEVLFFLSRGPHGTVQTGTEIPGGGRGGDPAGSRLCNATLAVTNPFRIQLGSVVGHFSVSFIVRGIKSHVPDSVHNPLKRTAVIEPKRRVESESFRLPAERLIISTISIVLIGAFISIFPNQLKAPQS